MIRIIHRCMTESKLTEKKWQGHFAFMHLKEFNGAKEIYLNGKPLKWFNRFKNGDIIEVIDRPHVLSTIFGAIGAALLSTIGISVASTATAAIVAGVVATTAAVAAIGIGIAGAFAGRRGVGTSSTQRKEYSSTTQPELKGANNDISNDIVPVVFGTTLQTPSYAQTPYRLVQDGTSTNRYRQYFIPNYSNVVYSDFKLGETSFNDYSVDYLKVTTASGSNTFIGYENCTAISVDEELSYNADESVNQSSTYSYNVSTSATSVSVALELKFTNVTLAKFSNKKFKVTVNTQNGGTDTASTHEFTVTSSNITQSGSYYIYNYSHSWTVNFDTLVSIQVAPTTKTRNNSTENTDELDVTLTTESVTAGSYNNTVTLNHSLNRYKGTTSEVLNTSPDNCTEIDVFLSFPQGLYKIDDITGDRHSRTSIVEIMFKKEGGSWQPISDANSLYVRNSKGTKRALSTSTTTVSGAKVTVHSPDDLNNADQLFFRPIGFAVDAGKYTVRVRSADFSDKTNYDIGVPHCAEIQFRCTGNVVEPSILPQVNQIAFEATAYKGLSGTLKKFNYIAKAVIPIWNGSNWNDTAVTSNPAAIIRYLLTDSSVNPRAESINHIDNDSLVEYYNWCEESGYKADGIVAEACKIGEIINNILQNTQTAMIPLYNGKHTFVIDKPNKTPIGLFNMHNSWNFKWTPRIGRQTEAIRASFVENDDWAEEELTRYWYNGQVNNAPEVGKSDLDYELIKKEYKYVNDRASVEKIVAFELETIQTKRNEFEFDVNLEAVNMMLLDRIYVSNTANMQNESTGLIKSVIVENGNLTGFELYADIDIPENAKIVIRSLDYDNEKAVINIYDVVNSGTSYIVEIEPIAYDGIVKGAGDITGIQDTWHYDGDLFTLGQDTIYDCTVIDIKYNDDGTATITARDY